MKLKKMILVATSVSIGLTIAFFGILQVASHEVIAALPEETRTCLPRQGLALAAANPRLLAETRSVTAEYHLYHLQNDSHEYVVTVGQDGRCKLLSFSAETPLSSQIPLSVAKQLTLIKLKKAIAQVGKPELKRQMQQVFLSSPDDTLSPELRWALGELGLR